MNLVERVINKIMRVATYKIDTPRVTEIYIQVLFKRMNGYKLDLKNPKTFDDKINWMKIHDRRAVYTTMVDKYAVKDYVINKIGEEYVIPVIDCWNTFDEIDFDKLPSQFVLKANHDCGSVVICNNKKNFQKDEARLLLSKALKRNYFWGGREWPYKNVKPLIFAEKYVENLADNNYKFFCFNGKVKAVYVAPFREKTVDYFDENYNHLDIYTRLHGPAEQPPVKPENFELMKELAEKLAEDIPHVRVDLYEADGKVYFGEMTFFHEAGFTPFLPDKWNKLFGEWIVLD